MQKKKKKTITIASFSKIGKKIKKINALLV